MILEVRRRTREEGSLYEICEDGLVLLLAENSQSVTGKTSSELGMILKNLQDTVVQNCTYEEVEQSEDTGIPEDWIRTGSTWKRYHLTDEQGDDAGNCYFTQRGISGNRILLEKEGIFLCGYPQYDGSREVISFYVGRVQVGQLTRPVASVTEEFCWIHMLDLYDSWLPLMAHFAVLYEENRRRRSRDTQKSANLMQVLESVQNQDAYHRDFVEQYFGQEESMRLDTILDENAQQMQTQVAGEARHVGRWMILGWAAVLALFLGVLWIVGL